MYDEDIALLRCPETMDPLTLVEATLRDEDGEILTGTLKGVTQGKTYPIENGIPRFTEKTGYNRTWDFKWTRIDRGRGLNYRMIDPDHPSGMQYDNIYDRNAYDGRALKHMRDRLVLDIGCGVGQYAIRSLRDSGARKVVGMDLTRGVDMFRKIMLERFPQFKRRLLLVQASVFKVPFAPETFDYVYSLGVLHHTGETRDAIRSACRLVKEGGEVNIWVYAAALRPFEVNEASHKVPQANWLFRNIKQAGKELQLLSMRAWMGLFRRLGNEQSFAIVKLFSSGLWYRLSKLPVINVPAKIIFSTVLDDERDWQLINNWDGYCNMYAESWSEHELFPVFRDAGIAIKGISDWRTGFWGRKTAGYYD